MAAGLKQDELLARTATDVITFPNMDTGGVYEGIQYDGVQYIDLQVSWKRPTTHAVPRL